MANAVARLETFLVLMAGLVYRPLDWDASWSLKLVGNVEEAEEDLARGSPAQRTRPHPRRGYAYQFVQQNAGLLALVSGVQIAVAFGRGWFELSQHTFVAVAAIVATSTCGALAGRVVQRVAWAWGTADLAPPPSCALASTYQDPEMLAKVRERMKAIAGDPTTPTIVHQPKGGFCGLASIASMFRSCPGAAQKYIKYPRYRTYLTMDQALAIVQTLAGLPNRNTSHNNETITPTVWGGASVESVSMLGGRADPLSYAEFKQEISLLNDRRTRLIAMFSCAALDSKRSSDASFIQRLEDVPLAHWTPAGAYLESEDLILMQEVRKNVGSYLVPAERLFAAVNTVCCVTGRYRGMIKLTLHDINTTVATRA